MAKDSPRFAIQVELPEHRRILFGSMVEAAERHAGVLNSHWLCVDSSNDGPVYARAVPDTQSASLIRIVLAVPGQLRREMVLHWPLRSAELFATLNQASLWLGDPGQPRSVATGVRLEPRLAGRLLLDWLDLRSRGESAASLRAESRVLLHLDAQSDRCVTMDPALACLDDIRKFHAPEMAWQPGVAPATDKVLGSSEQCLWQLAEASADAGLLEPLRQAALHLRGWPPQVVRGPASWTRILRQLRQQDLTAAELIKRADVSQRELAWFLNGCLATGYVRSLIHDSTIRPSAGKLPAQTGGGRFWTALNSIRLALGMNVSGNGWSGTDRS